MPRALLTRVMLAAAAVALVLVLGELWARWTWPELPPVPVLPEAYADLPKLTKVSELIRPNQRGVFNGALHETNRFGLRSDEHELEAAPGTFRIAAIGDSFVMGEAVSKEERYTDLVEHWLNEEATDGTRYEIINLGVSGFDLSAAVDRLEKIGLQFHPDLLIYGFTINDIEGPNYRRFEGGTVPVLPVFQPTSRLYGLVRTRLSGARELLLSPPEGSYLYELDYNYFENPEAWKDFVAAMDRLRDVARQERVCTVVFVHTHLFHLNRWHPFRRHYRAISEEARSRGFHVIPSLPHFLGREIYGLWTHVADSHPNARGHTLLASALKEGLGGLPAECWAARARDASSGASPGLTTERP